ncbi:TFIIE beta domain-containing protein [Heracleum sosnowskyi]|uniref:Transcription initiation factor IIE subunit beta n=1 Tax=Heracleum sosnowskyi TaxID=360622 RepID=A0AAD8GTW5_9APIA|nr:TFIIE beta domain-containing protein [Heracleum sosnowskyi]
MALKESLDRFKKQQEMCQKTLSSIKASSSSTPRVTPYNPANAMSAAPAVKFSSDIERLQQINNIRNTSAAAQTKRAIDLLKETRQALTADQINEACYVDVKANKDVFDRLSNNFKVYYDGTRFFYKPKHDLEDKTQLLKLIQDFPEGIAVADLEDAYPSVDHDLKALKAAGEIWLVSNSGSAAEDMAYPNNHRAIEVDDDLKQLFRGIELPRDMIDIEKDLHKNGMKPATNTGKRRAQAQVLDISIKPKQKKKHGISKRTKLTNTHLPELFKDLS